jgi:hypothetical protein
MLIKNINAVSAIINSHPIDPGRKRCESIHPVLEASENALALDFVAERSTPTISAKSKKKTKNSRF